MITFYSACHELVESTTPNSSSNESQCYGNHESTLVRCMGKQQQQQKAMWLGIKLPGTAGLLGANRLKNFCFLKELRSEEILLWKTVQ